MIMSRTGVSAYAYVYTRVRGMIGKLLQPAEFYKMSNCPDLPSLLAVLKNTDYAKYLENTKENLPSSRRASYDIHRKLTDSYRTIIKYAPESAQPILDQTFKLYELDNLKAVLRGIEIGEHWETIRYMLFPMQEFQTLPFEEMVKSGSVERAIEYLHASPYYPAAVLALDRFKEENSLFPLEVALDLDYWRKAWDQVNTLPKNERQNTQKLIGLIVDKNNLTWAARYGIYHHLSESEIINYTLPFGYKIDDEIIRSIATGMQLPELVAKAYPSITPLITSKEGIVQKLPLIEVALTRMFLQTCRSVFAGKAFDLSFILAYLFILEIELQDITLLIEAKALGIPPERYNPYLINQVVNPGKN